MIALADEGATDRAEWTVARIAGLFTPKRAAGIRARAAAIRLGAEPNPRIDALIANDPGHRMFVYCPDAVARRAV